MMDHHPEAVVLLPAVVVLRPPGGLHVEVSFLTWTLSLHLL